MIENEKPLATSVEKAAQLLGISRNLAFRLAREGSIPTVRFGERRLLVPMSELKKLLTAHEQSNEYGKSPEGLANVGKRKED